MAEPTRPQPITTTCTDDSPRSGARAPSACAIPGEATPGTGNGGAATEFPSRGGARRAERGRALRRPYHRAVPSLSDLGQLPKRLVLGRAVRSDRPGESLLPKRYALPIFASDPLSSVAYATQEILIVLTLGGTAFLYLAPWLAVGGAAVDHGGAVLPAGRARLPVGRWRLRGRDEEPRPVRRD